MSELNTKKKRPLLLKIIIVTLSIIAVSGWLRAYQSIYQWQTLLEFNIQPGPWYSLITGVLIGLVASIGVVVTWLRLVWSTSYVKISLVVLTLGWWLDYLLFTQNQTSFYNLTFRIFDSVLYLAFVFGYFHLQKKKQEGSHHEKRI